MRISDWSSDVCSSDLDEAVENAIKIARAATRSSGVIAFTGGFNGRTIMTSALTGKVAPYKAQFGPMPGGVHHIPFPTLTGGSVEERSEEHTSELQSLMRISNADSSLKKKITTNQRHKSR